MDEIEIIQRLTDVDNRSKSNTHRLDRLEALTDSIHSLTQSVALMAQKQDATAGKLDELTADVKELKAEPGEHWKTLVKAALTAIVAALIGYALAHIGL